MASKTPDTDRTSSLPPLVRARQSINQKLRDYLSEPDKYAGTSNLVDATPDHDEETQDGNTDTD